MKQDERSCLEDLIAGHDAWETFWQMFGFFIVSEVRKFRYSDPSLVDDIYQDLCIKLMRNNHAVIRRYLANPFRGSFAALLRTITKRMLIDYYRKHGKREHQDQEYFENTTNHSPESEWSGNPEKRQIEHNGVADILLEVSGGDQESETYRILYLRFVEGLGVNVIAERFSLKSNTVTQRIKYHVGKVRDKHKYNLMDLIDEE